MVLFAKKFRVPHSVLWEELSTEMGAVFERSSTWKPARIVHRLDSWDVTLDTFTVSTGKTMSEYTRMRLPFESLDGFRFRCSRKGFFTRIKKMFGIQSTEVGIPEFDNYFIARGNHPEQIVSFFSNTKIISLLGEFKNFEFKIVDDEGWLGTRFPKGVDELYFQVPGVVKDKHELRKMFVLFSASIRQLHKIGCAGNKGPQIHLK